MEVSSTNLSEFKLSPELKTLNSLLKWRARTSPDKKIFAFLEDGETEAASLTYLQLETRAIAIAAQLQRTASQGDRALLLCPTGLDLISAFFGCAYSGMISVPTPLPDPDSSQFKQIFPRLRSVWLDSKPTTVISTHAVFSSMQSVIESIDKNSVNWILADAEENDATFTEVPSVDPRSLVTLLYTSGSTADPKGVMVSHGNLMFIGKTWASAEHDYLQGEGKTVLWMPPYHVSGLTGFVEALFTDRLFIFMDSKRLLESPFSWLKAVSDYRAQSTGGVNFSYDLCVDLVTLEQKTKLDLSCLDLAFNAAEVVRTETQRRFSESFASCGFKPEAFHPCYGLTETTSTVCLRKSNLRSIALEFRADPVQLELNKVQEILDPSKPARSLLGNGVVIEGLEVRIINPDTATHCAPDEVGEIWISGPSVTQGYWNKSDETERVFHCHTQDTHEGPFLRTGDLGFFWQNNLFIAGRVKDLIIINGRNFHPTDIEGTVELTHPSLIPGSSSVFSIDPGEGEKVVILVEINREHPDFLKLMNNDKPNDPIEFLSREVQKRVAERYAVPIHSILLLAPGSLLKTPSGKVQRQACRKAFLMGTFFSLQSKKKVK